jgi:UDP-2,3-diacylglucosamine hydrolase
LARSGCVVIKVSKPNQDLRFDVPAVGLETIKILRHAGAVALALEAEKTLLLEKDALLAEADSGGIAVVGISV